MTATSDTEQDTSFAARDRELEIFVGRQVSRRQREGLADNSAAVSALARLRRGLGSPLGSDPELWALAMTGLPELLADPRLYSAAERDGAATPCEQAAYDAITLHAWHQQSRREPMHVEARTLGAAVRALGQRSDAEEAVRRRFHAVGTARERRARMVYLRALVTQLRDYHIPLDYGRLARDLRRLQQPDLAPRVRLQWSRDYHQSLTVAGEAGEDTLDTTTSGDNQ